MSNDQENRVLSIQSTVVSGYVGNKCATFSLQVLGFDVCPLNSVQLSNHTGYKCFKGQVLNSSDIDCLYDGLKQNEINGQFSHLITGYIGSKSFLEKVGEIIQDLKDCNKGLIYVCDPVMGDNGKLYVPEELLPVYRDVIIPQADIVTPNQFEADYIVVASASIHAFLEFISPVLYTRFFPKPLTDFPHNHHRNNDQKLLTGIKISCEDDALKAMDYLHDKGPKTVVLSSTNLGSEGSLLGLASTRMNGKSERYRIEMRYLDAIFVGTGDLFASCLMAWMSKDKDLKLALEKTVSTVQAVIKRTLKAAQEAAGPGKTPTPAQMELRLIQSKSDIELPEIMFDARQIL